jgi:Uma2 family endonuclease
MGIKAKLGAKKLMVLATAKRYTVAEYLEQEQKAEFKSEFVDGEIIAMAGASANHHKISLTICRLFPQSINGKEYDIFMSDMRLWMPAYNRYTYPDVVVTDGKPVFTDAKQTAITNACLIVEILSSSTEENDRSSKFKYYRSIPTFREYLLIEQQSYEVEQYTKQPNGKWLLTEYLGEEAVIKLESVSFEISLKDLYKRVDFEVEAKL